jgi:hypothetical protein
MHTDGAHSPDGFAARTPPDTDQLACRLTTAMRPVPQRRDLVLGKMVWLYENHI